jgi:hypothetical protein
MSSDYIDASPSKPSPLPPSSQPLSPNNFADYGVDISSLKNGDIIRINGGLSYYSRLSSQ